MTEQVDKKWPPMTWVRGGEFQDGYVLIPDCDTEEGDVDMTFPQACAAVEILNRLRDAEEDRALIVHWFEHWLKDGGRTEMEYKLFQKIIDLLQP